MKSVLECDVIDQLQYQRTGTPQDFFPAVVGKFIGIAWIFSRGCTFSCKKVDDLFSRRPQNISQNY